MPTAVRVADPERGTLPIARAVGTRGPLALR
jgi:hypothetical protein